MPRSRAPAGTICNQRLKTRSRREASGGSCSCSYAFDDSLSNFHDAFALRMKRDKKKKKKKIQIDTHFPCVINTIDQNRDRESDITLILHIIISI